MSRCAVRLVVASLVTSCLVLSGGARGGQALAGGPAPPADAAAPAQAPAAGEEPASAPVPAKDFAFQDLRGAARSLTELRGRVVLLEFWAPWCVPCRKGFPWLDGLQRRHEKAGLQVLAVTLETDDASVSSFLAEHPASFLVGRDRSGKSAELYEVAAMPTTILIDREGRELARFEGGGDSLHAPLEKAIEAALGGRGVEAAPVIRKAGARGHLRPWERGYLADPIMSLDGDRLTRGLKEHIHASKEAAAGDGGVAGGGCGCN